MVVEEEGVPVFYFGADEIIGGVPIHGDHGEVVEKEVFSF